MSTAFIFHGTVGHPEENWFPWMKEKLESAGYSVIVPQFPTPAGESLDAWFQVFEVYKDRVDENTIVIGHSLGGLFLLHVLARLPHPIRAACFVGTPLAVNRVQGYSIDPGFDFDNHWEDVKNKAEHFVVFQSDNDPYVPLDNGTELATHLAVELSSVPGAGHFNEAAGYLSFEELWKNIEPFLQSIDEKKNNDRVSV